MKRYFPSKKSLTILKVLMLLLTITLSILSRIFLHSYPILMWASLLLFWTLFIVLVIIYLPFYFQTTCYYVSSYEVSKQSGVLIESKQLMKVNSIQYITRIVTPFSQYTGFSFLKLNALGGSVTLLFLSENDANDIYSTISATIRQHED